MKEATKNNATPARQPAAQPVHSNQNAPSLQREEDPEAPSPDAASEYEPHPETDLFPLSTFHYPLGQPSLFGDEFQLGDPTSQIDWNAMAQPYFNRNIPQFRFGDYDAIQARWTDTLQLALSVGFDAERAAWLSNTLTPMAVDSALKGDYPTAAEIFNREAGVSPTILSHTFQFKKLEVGAANDKYEQEADAVADRVMRMPEPFIQKKCAECEEEETLQTKPLVQLSVDSASSGTQVKPWVQSQIETSRGSGQTLPDDTRNFMESRIGADFSEVKIHTDEKSVQMSRELGARAFTVGKDVHFGRGQFSPESSDGKRLLAHELAHTVQQGAAGEVVQRGLWSSLKGAAKKLGGGIKKGLGAVGGAVGSAWNTATGALGKAAGWAINGVKKLGKKAWGVLKTAGAHVWKAIKWFGNKAWAGIKWLGTFLWEKLALIGTNLWSFLSNIPVRLWRFVVHSWEGIKDFLGAVGKGLLGMGKFIWRGVKGVFTWIGEGVAGAAKWLFNGVKAGARWAIEFIKNPSLGKLWEGLTGSLSWAWSGMKKLGKWGWEGVAAAAVWAWEGLKGLGGWLWEGIKSAGPWAGKMLLYILDLVGFGEALQIIWGLIFRMRKLTQTEIDASRMVHPAGMIPYDLVRIDENSLISKIGGAAVTTMHIIHVPKGGIPIDVMVHELSHVAQYEKVGSVYMAQALHAQSKYGRTGGVGSGSAYDYTRTGSLPTLRAGGTRFKDLNRESQAELIQDYYLCLTSTPPNPCPDHVPFIQDMQRGEF